MSAPTYTARELSRAFGVNHDACDGKMPMAYLPLNQLQAASDELHALACCEQADSLGESFWMALLHLADRCEVGAKIGHQEIRALLKQVEALEAKLAAQESTVTP